MNLSAEQWILFITFLLIYGIFLAYDLFRRGGEEKYGYYAYALAVLPANYFWYVLIKNEEYSFGYAGAMTLLCGLWILLVIRDIFIKDKSEGIKDADDVALMLLISVAINWVASAVIPEIPNSDYMTRGANNYWNYFYMPVLDPEALYGPDPLTALSFRILVTILVLLVLIPILSDLRGTKANVVALIVLTAIFMAPLWFVASIWNPGMSPTMMAVTMFLGAVIFFIILLAITRGQGEK